MDGYSLSRGFWDFAFENPEKVKPTHIAIYFFAVEHCNRLGWKVKFGLPTAMVLDAIGVKSYSVYKKCFDDLAEWGFFDVLEYSKNQYSANIIALKENCKALDKALDKAMVKHVSKQVESTYQSNSTIDKHITIKQVNNEQAENKNNLIFNELINSEMWIENTSMQSKSKFIPAEVKKHLKNYNDMINVQFDIKNNKTEYCTHFVNWLNKQEKKTGIKKPSLL